MEIPIYDQLWYYATPPNNYVGTFMFLAYIVLALYETISSTASLHNQYNAIYHNPKTSAKETEALKTAKRLRARHIKIYAFLASVSFATLSYHMLFFLIEHYLTWSGDKALSMSMVSAEKVRRWMLESTLFQDFAHDLFKTPPNAAWTQAAILATWFWNIWMAGKARFHCLKIHQMQPLVLLSQTLPISFTVSLFLIQLHLSSPDIQNPQGPPNTKRPLRKLRASLQIPNIMLNAILLSQCALRHNQISPTLIFVERFILLLPHEGIVSLEDHDVVKCITIAGGFVSTTWYMGRKELAMKAVVGALFDGGYAVKALGWDALLGGVVWAALSWDGGMRDDTVTYQKLTGRAPRLVRTDKSTNARGAITNAKKRKNSSF